MTPLISCLCVTERRPAFIPWLLWCFDRQAWSQRELVIVDSSLRAFEANGRDDVRVVAGLPQGASVGRKRNVALQEARGEIITWFDDDDWQHPEKLSWLAEALRHDVAYAGSRRAWFVDLMESRCVPHRGRRERILFNSAGFRTQAVFPFRFPENLRKGSDTRWLRDLAANYDKVVIIEREDLFFWLCHQNNVSNPVKSMRFPERLQVLKDKIGADAWGDTDDALDALRKRLLRENKGQAGISGGLVAIPRRRAEPQPPKPKTTAYYDVATTSVPVSLMIKATIMDAPFLDIMVRHMIAQAGCSFSERAIVVDRQPALTGKYRTRLRATDRDLDRILDRLLTDGIVDHVRTVDMTPSLIQDVMARYFQHESDRVPTHAATGGPIYATLFGLESMTTDYVLQMDADILFYAGGSSWVEQALEAMSRDSRIWLMMTHPGPPAGPPGQSLGPRNRRHATWDGDLQIWRFRSATTRYFLCDRRNLRNRLLPLRLAQGYAPLEQSLSHALQVHGAFRGSLGTLSSWHLHVWYHGDPFPKWAPLLTRAIEAGRFPTFQRGEYDLRLDRPRDRLEWGKLLSLADEHVSIPATSRRNVDRVRTRIESQPRCDRNVGTATKAGNPVSDPRRDDETRDLSDVAPATVIIPVRNRAGQRLRNSLRSLYWQTAGPPAQVIVVSFGSTHEINRELSSLCAKETAELITTGDPARPWNKSLALNIGIRATRPEVPFVATMDADMVLAPNFFEVVLKRLQRDPPALVLSRISDLPAGVTLPPERTELLAAFAALRNLTRLRPRFGSGGFQAASRTFFFDIQGYDEDLRWWGAMDKDIVNRARLAGLDIDWVEDRTAMLHQWHPRKHTILACQQEIGQAKLAWRHNHELVRARSKILKRNSRGWGGVTE